MRCRLCLPPKHFIVAQKRLVHAYSRHRQEQPPPTEIIRQFLKHKATTLSDNFRKQRSVLEDRLFNLSRELSRISGYQNIEGLKQHVEDHEKLLTEAREAAMSAKQSYANAVAARAASQRESNNLLARKDSWTTADVSRFTELVRQDHDNEQFEREARLQANAAEEAVDKIFVSLIRAILARYHEEQIWSDKIRSLSTYGSLAITGANVLIFLLVVILVEPWRRRKLVERLEIRIAQREGEMLAKTEQGLMDIMNEVVALKASMGERPTSPTIGSNAPLVCDAITQDDSSDLPHAAPGEISPLATADSDSTKYAYGAAGLALGLALALVGHLG